MKKIIFSLIPCLVLFLAAEICLRASSLDEYLSARFRKGSLLDHSVFWKPAPVEENPLKIHHNYKNQFRGIYYKQDKPGNIVRIICLGGSSTWGWPLKNTQRIYPALLEKKLNKYAVKNKLKKRFEVINAGVGGYSSFQQIMYLKKNLLKYGPDIVTICAGANDSSDNSDIHITMTDKEYWESLKKKKDILNSPVTEALLKLKRFFMNFRVFNAFDEIVFRIKNNPKTRVPLNDFNENMNKLIMLSKKYNFTVLFITEAHRVSDAILKYIEIMEKTAENNENAFFIDTRSFLNYRCFLDEMHPVYKGHEIIAETIFNKIKQLNLINVLERRN